MTDGAAGNRRDGDVEAGVALAVRFLEAEIAVMRAAGVPVGEDDYRGLYIPEREVDRLLAGNQLPSRSDECAPELVALRGELHQLVAGASGRLRRVIELGRLGAFETGCVLLCLAAERDPGVERLLAYAQDDVTRRRPRVELLLRLFASGEGDARDAFLPGGPLVGKRVLRLIDEPGQAFTPLSSRAVALEPRVAEHLLGSDAIVEPLHGHVRVERGRGEDAALLPEDLRMALSRLAASAEGQRPGSVALVGQDAALVRAAAGTIAQALGRAVLIADIEALAGEVGAEEAIPVVLREAVLQQALPLFEGADGLEPLLRARLSAALEGQSDVPVAMVALGSAAGWPGFFVEVGELDFERRRGLWSGGVPGPELAGDVDALAAKFRLGVEEIRRAVEFAGMNARWRDGDEAGTAAGDLYAAARSQSTPILSGLAHKVAPHYEWEDLVLPADALDQLREISAQVEHHHRVYERWGFERKLALSRGVIALFAGNSGTGKTMAADVMANALGLDLYRIDLSAVVSKYIGETEKNLDAIFREAERSNGVLFFDEADALFGKRSEVKDAHDRYANIETAYLLQRMEEYSGIVILATNLKMNLDEAFIRRLHFVVDFPMPDEGYRKRIWRGAIPEEAPVATDVDWDFLARQFKVSGGNIKNAVVAGAFLAAADDAPIGMAHFVRGMRREYQKLGRMVTEAEFGPYTGMLQA